MRGLRNKSGEEVVSLGTGVSQNRESMDHRAFIIDQFRNVNYEL